VFKQEAATKLEGENQDRKKKKAVRRGRSLLTTGRTEKTSQKGRRPHKTAGIDPKKGQRLGQWKEGWAWEGRTHSGSRTSAERRGEGEGKRTGRGGSGFAGTTGRRGCGTGKTAMKRGGEKIAHQYTSKNFNHRARKGGGGAF